MVKKLVSFDIYIKTSEQTPTHSYTAKQKVMSNDNDSAQIIFNLLDVSPSELSGVTASVMLYMQDGSFFQSSDVVIDRNTIIYTMKPEETKHSGSTKVQIVLKKGSIQTASIIYNFDIDRGLEKYPITEVMIQDWTTLTAEAKAFVEQIEGFTLAEFVENKMGEELANLEVNYAGRLTGLETKDTQLTAQLAQTTNEKTFNVIGFGAVGDNETDDTSAITTAILEAGKVNGTVLFPEGYNFLTTQTINFGNTINVTMNSPIVLDSSTPQPAIVYGSRSTTTKNKKLKFWANKKTQSNWLDYSMTSHTDNMFVGVKLINIGESEINIVSSTKFTVGVELLAHVRGFFFNNIHLGAILDNKSGIEIASENGGWPNGNDFFGGGISVGSNVNLTETRKYVSSVIRSGSYGSNANVFHNLRLEGGANGAELIPFQLQRASYWIFKNVRGESFANKALVKFDDLSNNNVISFRVLITNYSEIIESNGSRNNFVYITSKQQQSIDYLKNKALTFDSGLIKDNIYLDQGNPAWPLGISNMMFYNTSEGQFSQESRMTNSGSANPVVDDSGHIRFNSYNMGGVRIDTSDAKRFLIENNEQGWRISLGLFDEDGNALSGDDNLKNVTTTGSSMHPVRWYYNYNADFNGKNIEFIVSDIVKSVVVMVHGKVKRFKIYSLGDESKVLKPEINVLPKVYLAGENTEIYQLKIDGTGNLQTELTPW